MANKRQIILTGSCNPQIHTCPSGKEISILIACTNLLSKSRNHIFHLLYLMRQKVFHYCCLSSLDTGSPNRSCFFTAFIYFPTPLLPPWRTQVSEKWWLWEDGVSSSKKMMDARSRLDKTAKQEHLYSPFYILPLCQDTSLAALRRVLQTSLTVWGQSVYLKKSVESA